MPKVSFRMASACRSGAFVAGLLSDDLSSDELASRPAGSQDGPDAAQEALIAVRRDQRSLRDPAALYGWVRVIAVREAIRVARRARHEIADELVDVPHPGDPQLVADVRDVLARLSPDHRAVLVLRDLEGLDERSVSALLSVEVGTVKSRLHRARQSFRKVRQR